MPPANKHSLDGYNEHREKSKYSLDIMIIVPPADKYIILSIWGRQWKERPGNDVDTKIVLKHFEM